MKDATFNEFFEAMRRFVPEHARVMSCQFRGDPNDDIPGKWRARVINYAHAIDDFSNVYLCVSAMQRNARGEFRRRKENFAGGILLMIDDVGDGRGAKFPLSVLDALAPTALVETSPGNFQGCYFFDSLVTDMDKFDALIRAFIAVKFLSDDTGMAGVNRVFRPPAGVNGKAKYRDPATGKPWRVRCVEWAPERRYSVEAIAQAFGLDLIQRVATPRDAGQQLASQPERIRAFITVRALLRSAGALKREEPDYSGWIQITCPWVDEHTDAADTGAAIRLPAEENDWYGAFRCHHGHCADKGWRHLTEKLAEEMAWWVDVVNGSAGDFSDYQLIVSE